MRRSRELVLVVALVAAVPAHAQTPDAKPAETKPADAKTPDSKAADTKDTDTNGGLLGFKTGGSKEPITITSDNLEYQYKDGIVIYRGDVLAVQGDVKVKSNELRITLAKSDDAKGKGAKGAPSDFDDTSPSKLQSVVAIGSVRIDQGASWAVGGKATFEQSNRTLVLTENPVLHNGPNEIVGDRVIVYLDENRSIVEGGRKRIKAVLFPGKDKDNVGKPGEKDQAAKAAAGTVTRPPQ
jgi:lipopolysaccharide export system protein LptA